MSKKSDETPHYRLNNSKDELEIYVNTSIVKKESRVKAEFSFLHIVKNDLIIEGIAYFLVEPDFAKTHIFLKVNNDSILCKQYSNYSF